jgi:hypothetical protein
MRHQETMARGPRFSGGASSRQLTVLAAAATLVAILPLALYVAFSGPQARMKPVRIIAKVVGAPVDALPTAIVDERPRLAIVRVEARHIRSGGIRPGDEFDTLVTVRNHGVREQKIRVDVLREPGEILPFRSEVRTVPPGKDRVFTLRMTASARYIIGRHYLRRVYLVKPKGFGVAAFDDATPFDNERLLRVPVGLYVDLEITEVRPGRFRMDFRKGRYRPSRQDYEITITNRGTARYERGARYDISLHTEQNPRSLTHWSREIDKAIEPGERITINGSFDNLWKQPPWVQEQKKGLFEGAALPGFPMRLIAILRMPIDLDPARRNNQLDTRFLIGVEPIRREKSLMLFDPMAVRSGRLGFTDQ